MYGEGIVQTTNRVSGSESYSGMKIPSPQGGAGSTPAFGTKYVAPVAAYFFALSRAFATVYRSCSFGKEYNRGTLHSVAASAVGCCARQNALAPGCTGAAGGPLQRSTLPTSSTAVGQAAPCHGCSGRAVCRRHDPSRSDPSAGPRPVGARATAVVQKSRAAARTVCWSRSCGVAGTVRHILGQAARSCRATR